MAQTQYMMSGKAIARALRELYLIEVALTTKLFATVIPQGSKESEGRTSENVDGDTKTAVAVVQEHNSVDVKGSHAR